MPKLVQPGSLLAVAAIVFAACGDAKTPSSPLTEAGSSGDDGGGASTLPPPSPSPSPTAAPEAGLVTYGPPYEGGQFHLGPVDYEETQWHNGCAPGTKYAPAVRAAEGQLLAGLWEGIPNVTSYCDACILVKTAVGKTAILRVVTYGETTRNSIDVSPEAYKILDSGEYPRSMAWQFTRCPDTGRVMYEFQTGAHEYWTSLWVRNARIPISKTDVKSKNHAAYIPLTRGTDGSLTDASGFGKGAFTIRLTGIDGSTLEDTFDWPAEGVAGKILLGRANF